MTKTIIAHKIFTAFFHSPAALEIALPCDRFSADDMLVEMRKAGSKSLSPWESHRNYLYNSKILLQTLYSTSNTALTHSCLYEGIQGVTNIYHQPCCHSFPLPSKGQMLKMLHCFMRHRIYHKNLMNL